jgi:hypothetical protein
MKTDIKAVLKQVSDAIDSLKADTNDAGWSPQLGTAIGGLRAAKDGLEAHVQKTEAGGQKAEPNTDDH